MLHLPLKLCHSEIVMLSDKTVEKSINHFTTLKKWPSPHSISSTGFITSPNHPGNYPHNLEKTETIEVEVGQILRLEFIHFAVYACDVSTCPCDFVRITDGDGTTLMDKSCGDSDPSASLHFSPPIIKTRSNKVEIFFHTDGMNSKTGWKIRWTARAPGLNTLIPK